MSSSSPCSSFAVCVTSASLAAVPTTVCTRPEATSTPIWAFIPKCHWLPFFVWCISGSRLCCLFLVEDGAAMIVASDNRSLPHQQTALFQQRADLVEQPLCQFVPFQPMPEMQHRGRVGDRVAVQYDPGKAAQRLAIVEGILDRFISQPVPLLHKIDPQHALQRDRRPAAFALRIERGKARHQPRPRHHRFHLGQKLVAPRLLLLTRVLRLGKAPLTLHRSDPTPRTTQILPNPAPETELISAFP